MGLSRVITECQYEGEEEVEWGEDGVRGTVKCSSGKMREKGVCIYVL